MAAGPDHAGADRSGFQPSSASSLLEQAWSEIRAIGGGTQSASGMYVVSGVVQVRNRIIDEDIPMCVAASLDGEQLPVVAAMHVQTARQAGLAFALLDTFETHRESAGDLWVARLMGSLSVPASLTPGEMYDRANAIVVETSERLRPGEEEVQRRERQEAGVLIGLRNLLGEISAFVARP